MRGIGRLWVAYLCACIMRQRRLWQTLWHSLRSSPPALILWKNSLAALSTSKRQHRGAPKPFIAMATSYHGGDHMACACLAVSAARRFFCWRERKGEDERREGGAKQNGEWRKALAAYHRASPLLAHILRIFHWRLLISAAPAAFLNNQRATLTAFLCALRVPQYQRENNGALSVSSQQNGISHLACAQ